MQSAIMRYPSPAITASVKRDSVKRDSVKPEDLDKSVQKVQHNNEKLRSEYQNYKQRLEFLETFIQSAVKFDNTGNVEELKGFVQMNYKRFHDLVDEVFKSKENIENEKMKALNLERKVAELNQKLKEAQTEKENKIQQQEKALLQNAGPIKAMEAKAEALAKELEIVKEKHQQYQEKSKKKDFFKEYDNMCIEVDGLRTKNMNLTETIKKLQEKAAESKPANK